MWCMCYQDAQLKHQTPTQLARPPTRPAHPATGLINVLLRPESLLPVQEEVSPTWATRAAVKRRNMSCDTDPPFPHRLAAVSLGTLWDPRGNSAVSDYCCTLLSCVSDSPHSHSNAVSTSTATDGLIAVSSPLPVCPSAQPRGLSCAADHRRRVRIPGSSSREIRAAATLREHDYLPE